MATLGLLPMVCTHPTKTDHVLEYVGKHSDWHHYRCIHCGGSILSVRAPEEI